jgi:hypothetical protein
MDQTGPHRHVEGSAAYIERYTRSALHALDEYTLICGHLGVVGDIQLAVGAVAQSCGAKTYG